jgi:hypothetical protein
MEPNISVTDLDILGQYYDSDTIKQFTDNIGVEFEFPELDDGQILTIVYEGGRWSGCTCDSNDIIHEGTSSAKLEDVLKSVGMY